MTFLTQDVPDGSISLLLVNADALSKLREESGEYVRNLLEAQQFEAKFGTMAKLYDGEGHLAQVIVGTNAPPSDPRNTLQLFAQLGTELSGGHTFHLPGWQGHQADWEQAALGWGLAHYRFTQYKKDSTKPSTLAIGDKVDLARITNILDAMFLARDLVNLPANDLGPEELAAKVLEIGEAQGAEVTVTEGEALLEANYPAVYAVGKGSYREPALIDLRWGDPSHPKLTLVGKGVIFDTGGLNLKPASGMVLMKKDMGGAAVTLALAELIMKQKLPVRLRLMIPAVENSPGRHAFRPGDVIETRKGTRVEIGNTDAEGRVILCDALYEAVSEDPDWLIDVATLTGAARVALGQDLPAFYTDSEDMAGSLRQAAMEVADPVWRMPLWHPYTKNLKSEIGDLNNMANTPMGGSITAALYLHEFVKPFPRWLHLDAYCWRMEALPGSPKGGEASALRALFKAIENRYRED